MKLDDITLKNTKSDDMIIIAGDFNAQMGRDEQRSETCRYSFGKTCNNGAKLLNFAANHKLVAINTVFSHKKGTY